jgi:hypothetical protein
LHLLTKPNAMQKQTSVYIPKPCHADWNEMTQTRQGKFCSACSKQVVDFSLMSDNQILKYLSGQSGNLCGRFGAEQLERPLIETKIRKKKSWWMAVAMPLLFLFDRSEAQENKLAGETTIIVSGENDTLHRVLGYRPSEILTGKVAVANPQKPASLIDTAISISNETIVTGQVVDENNNPLPYVTVRIKGTVQSATTDSLGNFSIGIKYYNDSATLIISYIGYKALEKPISLKDKNVNIKLQLEVALMGDVVVTGYAVQQYTGLVGGISVCRKVTRIEKIDSAVRRSLKITAFKIYPNPSVKGSLIHLEIKNAGEYQLQLLDNHSMLITIDNINTVVDKSVFNFSIPPNIASGIYYLRLINVQAKKSYTEKLIIQ